MWRQINLCQPQRQNASLSLNYHLFSRCGVWEGRVIRILFYKIVRSKKTQKKIYTAHNFLFQINREAQLEAISYHMKKVRIIQEQIAARRRWEPIVNTPLLVFHRAKFKMKIFTLDSKGISIVLAIPILSLLVTRFLFFFFSPQNELIGVIPDDAFYYIQIATHRAKDGIWTFDGTAPATGFHFLYGYFLVFIFKFFPEINWTNIYLIVGTISCLSISASSYFLTKTVADVYGKNVALAATLPFLSFGIIIQSTSMMESWLVIFFSSLTIFFLAKKKEFSFKFCSALFFIGLLGSLSRTDYGMLPGVLFCTILLAQKFKITPILARSFLILLGSVIGIFIVLVQNYFISGQLAQASAQTKFFWSATAGHSIYPPLKLICSTSLPFFDFVEPTMQKFMAITFFLAIAFSCLKSIKLLREEKGLTPTALLIGCVLTLVGYIFFYSHNSQALQCWYTSNFIAPISIITAAVFHFVLGRRALAPVAFLYIFYYISVSKIILSIPWPHQAGMMKAGQYIRTLGGTSTFSSWNAGIISHFSGKSLVNIDGLANDEVLPYIKKNKLMDYLKSKQIDYIVDYKEMIDNKNLRLRGGYADERIFRCLDPIGSVDANSQRWAHSELVLFKVDHDCL